MQYDKLVLATGSLPNKFGWPGQDLIGVQGMVSKQDLDSMEEFSKGLERAVDVDPMVKSRVNNELFDSRIFDGNRLEDILRGDSLATEQIRGS